MSSSSGRRGGASSSEGRGGVRGGMGSSGARGGVGGGASGGREDAPGGGASPYLVNKRALKELPPEGGTARGGMQPEGGPARGGMPPERAGGRAGSGGGGPGRGGGVRFSSGEKQVCFSRVSTTSFSFAALNIMMAVFGHRRKLGAKTIARLSMPIIVFEEYSSLARILSHRNMK